MPLCIGNHLVPDHLSVAAIPLEDVCSTAMVPSLILLIIREVLFLALLFLRVPALVSRVARRRLGLLAKDGALKAASKGLFEDLVRRTFLIAHAQHHLEAGTQVSWHHLKELVRILLVEALFQVVYKIVVSALVLEDRVEVGPWQLVVIDQVDKHVDARLDVITSRLAVAAA